MRAPRRHRRRRFGLLLDLVILCREWLQDHPWPPTMHRARTRWWRSREYRLNVAGVDVHCIVRGLHYLVRVQVWSGRSGKNPDRERRRQRHGRFRRSTIRSSTVATSGAMSKTQSTATEPFRRPPNRRRSRALRF
ncbi:uncharacterized protein [Triticum aestivum]|uniref:uncharacterized protein n=1 Tax=Triticum aestivum TaxID=4565 RepID=UPI001D011535|nr:uncharacterized protein LOC123133066 [Triticum aestivum]